MSTIADRATQLYLEKGFCCAEAVWLAFAEAHELSDADKNTGNKLSFAFCGGTGAKNLCGAAAGGALVLGYQLGRIPGEARNEDLPKYTKALIDAFEAQYGDTTCLKLKPKGDPKAAKAVCAEYVAFITAKTEELLKEGPTEATCT